ncbi:MAG TPA: YciI family protein, partial [Tahibacter sp.]|nr:YciI family protein [Tahibacter sp.]
SDASRAVVREIKAAGAWIFGGGILTQQASIVAVDGSVSDGPFPETKAVLGGFSIIEVASRDDALSWAAKLAAACRCTQEVREIMYDPES